MAWLGSLVPHTCSLHLEPAGQISPAAANQATLICLTPARCGLSPLYASRLNLLIFLLHLD